MIAFGPYKHIETIDFKELKSNRLFVISGNTGAGKTTIFDGICFALYGSASGEDRNDSKMLRSDFAEDDIHTSVKLQFELHGRTYSIFRQMPHIKKGNKSATGERNEFYELKDEKEIPCVDRQIVSEINKKIEELVGLTRDQFSQIVMLPQGEFRKLLTSQTENKEEVLRRIFKTEPYKWISEKLKERKRLTEEQAKQEIQIRDGYVNNIKSALPDREDAILFNVLSQEHYNIYQVSSGLENESIFYEAQIKIHVEKAENAYKDHDKKQKEYYQAKSFNDQFAELDEKDIELQNLTDQVSFFEEEEKKLDQANLASTIEVHETQANEWRHDERKKRASFEQAEMTLQKENKQFEQAKLTYESEQNKKNERDEAAKLLNRLSEYLPIVKEIDKNQVELARIKTSFSALLNNLQDLETNIKITKDLKNQLSRNIREMEKETDTLTDKQQILMEMRNQGRLLNQFLKLLEDKEEKEKDFLTKEQSYQKAQKHYDVMEKAWLDSQAGFLAVHLHDGEPCPVCGSIEHPFKAQPYDKVSSREELEVLKVSLNKKNSSYREAAANLKNHQEQLQIRGQEVEQYGIHIAQAQQSYNQLVRDGKNLAEQVEALKQKRESLSRLKDTLEQHEQSLAKLEVEKEKLQEECQNQKSLYDKKQAVYQSTLQSVPENVRVLGNLEKKIKEAEKQKKLLEKNWEESQEQFQDTKKKQITASSNLIHTERQLDEVLKRKNNAEEQFKSALLKANFINEAAYNQAKLTEIEREQLKTKVELFKQNMATVKKQVEDLKGKLKGKMRVNLAVLSSELKNLKEQYELTLGALNQCKEYYKEAIELKENILAANKRVVEKENHLNIVTDLYDVVRGQNSHKISFERYLQIEFLEQIIHVANERLKRISNGQFYLMRSDRQESRGRQSGLGLDVHDSYTGQNRDVKTLSGGEKFNASLCLALGLADVIQSYQGGVSIETMFIDEGFGSLDEESLNKAIDTLIDLQKSGRMVGVISHVQELKNTIPAILEVKKNKQGYSQTQFIIK